MRSSGKIVMTKEYPDEQPSFCDSMWACVLNDYVEDMEETSVLTDPSEKEVDHKILRRQERKERRERRRSSSGTRTRSRSKNRSRSKTRGSSRHHRRGSSSHSRVSSHSKAAARRDESRFEEESADSGRENTMVSPREVEEIKREFDEEVPIPTVPSREMRKSVDPEDSRRHQRKVDAEMDAREEKPSKKSPSKKERKRPPKLTIDSFGDDAPREATPSSKREEAPPVLFRPIKSRYNPSPKSSSSPRVMSPMSSPRSPSNLRVDSAEFNTMEDYQKKVLEARSKRSGRKFERIQAIRAKSMSHRAEP